MADHAGCKAALGTSCSKFGWPEYTQVQAKYLNLVPAGESSVTTHQLTIIGLATSRFRYSP